MENLESNLAKAKRVSANCTNPGISPEAMFNIALDVLYRMPRAKELEWVAEIETVAKIRLHADAVDRTNKLIRERVAHVLYDLEETEKPDYYPR